MGKSIEEYMYTPQVPVGTIISFFGLTAPEGYLACDGTIYNRADYPDLAEHLVSQFSDLVGDGSTTFKVPDLKGEFLRGTGTNSHADGGNGQGVGVHTGATALPSYRVHTDNCFYMKRANSSTANYIESPDKSLVGAANVIYSSKYNPNAYYTDNVDTVYKDFVKPTNTAVLYCIKY